MGKEGKEIVWKGERKENESREERVRDREDEGRRKRERERNSERMGRGIRSHLSRVADPDAIQQLKKLSSLG